MESVEKEIDRLLARFTDFDNHTVAAIEECMEQINKIRQELSEGPPDRKLDVSQTMAIKVCTDRIKETATRLGQEHKELHSSVSKVGKAVDKNFVSDFSAIVPDHGLDSDSSIEQVNHIVVEHFLRQGMMGVAETLGQEARLEFDDDQKDPFMELNMILQALKARNLEPALRWVNENKILLRDQNSSLEFKLHKLQFINLISQGQARQHDALMYSKNFEPFAASHAKELQTLMGTLLYLRQGVEASPYKYLLSDEQWEEICDVFTRDACRLLGLSVESPLSVVIKAGCAAVPPLMNIKQVMQQRHCHGVWNAKDELPVEIELKDCRFHSIFACPILRQQSNDANPPVRLVCGHVISRDALNKLANGNKVKCPYCPVEQSPSDAKHILF